MGTQAVLAEATGSGMAIVEPPTTILWEIRRFSTIDPNGVGMTIIAHMDWASDEGGH
jgi:hypothetical protein